MLTRLKNLLCALLFVSLATPSQAMFIQPDWLDPTEPGVGTNRYAYSNNDPVNKIDPNGNFFITATLIAVAVYKAVSVAITVVDTVNTINDLATGTLTPAEAAKQAAIDAAIGVTVGKVAAKFGDKLVDKLTGAANSCSFDGATPVHTSAGLKRIDQIAAGELVLSGDPVTGDTSYQRVLQQYSNEYPETVYLTVQSAEGEATETIVSNKIHPFFVVGSADGLIERGRSTEGHIYNGPIEGGHWVDAGDLTVGDQLRTSKGVLLEVVDAEIKEIPLTAFNLTVEKTETFYVGNSAFWVHNCGDGGIKPTDHSRQRAEQGRPTGTAHNDLTRARPGDIYTQPDGRFVVRAGKAREHVFEIIDGEIELVTTMGTRSKKAHQGIVKNGGRRPATQEEIDKLKDTFEGQQ